MTDTKSGKAYWRSMAQLEATPEFTHLEQNEFKASPMDVDDGLSRRTFLQLMGASVALAGAGGCLIRRDEARIVPYGKLPEDAMIGRFKHYCTSYAVGSDVSGLKVAAFEGRPTKVEGNPLHAGSEGSAHSWAQASILGLYDPDRSKAPRQGKDAATWEAFSQWWKARVDAQPSGQGIAFLYQDDNSPLTAQFRQKIQSRLPDATWHRHEPFGLQNMVKGNAIAFGADLYAVPDYSAADVILSLDGDFLGVEPGSVSATKAFAKRRRVSSPSDTMNRLYMVENSFSVTGAKADHRVRLPAGSVGAFALALAHELQDRHGLFKGVSLAPSAMTAQVRRIQLIAEDLVAAGRRSAALVVCGSGQAPELHALCALINKELGGAGKTVNYHPAGSTRDDGVESLVEALKSGQVKTLVILGGNPVYTLPADFAFNTLLSRCEATVHFGLHDDETGSSCTWHLPSSHALESWGDALAVDGRASLQQPLISPMYDTRSEVEVSALLAGETSFDAYEALKASWMSRSVKSEKAWRRCLHDGFVPGVMHQAESPRLDAGRVQTAVAILSPVQPSATSLEIVFALDRKIHDGRFANNGWLQELPDPMHKMAWDNPCLMSRATAASLGVSNDDEISIRLDGREILAAAWVLPGQAENSLTLPVGYGRDKAGRVGNGIGSNAYALRGSAHPRIAQGAVVTKTGKKWREGLATTQDHGSMEGRKIVVEQDLEDYRAHPHSAGEVEGPPLKSLFPEPDYSKGTQWGMVIDLNSCTGCGACTVACQSENNIPIVGREEVRMGREMHWIRLDRYFVSDAGMDPLEDEEPRVVTQPINCQHCENAPCEEVCPVAATTHSPEGLNDMAYNRCVGTRYCANNCPYKVRRFNFFHYSQQSPWLDTPRQWRLDDTIRYKMPESVKMAANPNVSVRSRGVMEKCSYCVQRINRARIDSKIEGRSIRDGEVTPACAQTCPADAIVFGDINDTSSRVHALKNADRGYELLAELNVKPRNSFLAALRNPHKDWA
ncbi:MAG: TAT-variant-translocated molybdopterin oxidoreductase [Planctomycetota bacterium]